MTGDFEFVGCFADTYDRAIPKYNGFVRTVDTCRAIAEANKHDVFGLQDWGECWTGKSDIAFDVSMWPICCFSASGSPALTSQSRK